KSRICPMLDFTMKSLPRYLLIVLALAGDSTMTSAFPMGNCIPSAINSGLPTSDSTRCNNRCSGNRCHVQTARRSQSLHVFADKGKAWRWLAVKLHRSNEHLQGSH